MLGLEHSKSDGTVTAFGKSILKISFEAIGLFEIIEIVYMVTAPLVLFAMSTDTLVIYLNSVILTENYWSAKF